MVFLRVRLTFFIDFSGDMGDRQDCGAAGTAPDPNALNSRCKLHRLRTSLDRKVLHPPAAGASMIAKFALR
jgi:hypothetical protein